MTTKTKDTDMIENDLILKYYSILSVIFPFILIILYYHIGE